MTTLVKIVIIAAVLLLAPATTAAEQVLPRIAIVIDDLGNSRFQQQFAQLPGPLTLAMLPHTPYAEQIAQTAQQNGKEVIIHMPMQASANADAGAGMLSSEDDKAETILLMEQAFIQIPQAVGMNNHMGSRLTALIEPMQWVMEQLALRNFYFLDSRTTAATQAENVAREFGIPVARRHVFLDNNPEPAEIALRWKDLIRHAHKHGEAIAIAHPHRSTLEFLKEVLPDIERHYGVKLVVASSLDQRPDTETIQLTEHKAIPKEFINRKDVYPNEN